MKLVDQLEKSFSGVLWNMPQKHLPKEWKTKPLSISAYYARNGQGWPYQELTPLWIALTDAKDIPIDIMPQHHRNKKQVTPGIVQG